MTKDFRIVGIGASAGGLKAINEFFDYMPEDTGLAFVVIQHLSPDFKSLMDELLAKHTSMPIKVIEGDTEVEENSIYLISSKSNIIIEDGVIKNIDRKGINTLNLPIDIFFHSLGEDLKEKSIGVILSGTGTDGSRGIRSIKEEGGLIFVQEPETAQFDGMPNAAIATNLIDAIMSPAKMAQKLASISKKTENGKTILLNIDEMTDLEIFKRILELVERESNIDFMDYRQNTLVRRLEKRMYLNQVQNVNDYYNVLIKRKEEVKLLFNEFLIGVTRFFRDKEAFEVLNEKVVANLFQAKLTDEPLRVWCVGCSTGEEAYSVAIMLTEYLENSGIDRRFKIFATDVDKNAIKKAGTGVFPESILNDVGNDYIERYFNKTSNGFKIKKSIRDELVFTAHDALNDPPFIHIDLLICRNMMIYLKPSVQKKLLSNFQFALNFKSFLFLGPSESISSVKDAFKAVNPRWNIFQLISTEKPIPVSRTRKIAMPSLRAREGKLKSISGEKDRKDSFHFQLQTEDFIAQEISQRFGPRSLFVNEDMEIIYINGDFRDLLLFPKAFADLSLMSRLKPEEHLLFKNGVRQALNLKEDRIYENVQFVRDALSFTADIQFSVFQNAEIEFPLVWIAFKLKNNKKENTKKGKGGKVIAFDDYKNEKLNALEYELNLIKKEKQFLVEQLEAANEELQSSNEELLAANEELQSTNEELQSVNEELYTVNTELQSKINELVISNNDISNLLKSTNIGIIFLDKDLCIRKFTPALKEQFDLQLSDVGRPISNFTNSFSLDISNEVRTVIQNGESVEKEVADHHGNTFLMRVLPYWSNEEELDGAVISFIDLNEIKEAQRAVKENAGKYQAIYKHTNNTIMILDVDGTILSSNIGAGVTYKAKGSVGTKFYEVEGIEEKERKEALELVLDTKESASYESVINGPSGRKWFDGTIVPILNDLEEVSSLILIAHDITPHKLKEHELEGKSADLEEKLFKQNQKLEKTNLELKEVNSYLDSFVHGAAHDLRAPLAQMKGMVSLLPKIESKEKVDKVLVQFKKGVEHMDNTLSGLIELIEFQKNTAEMISPVNLIEAYESCIEQLVNVIKEADAKIITDFQFKGEINFIPAYVQSVFYNLLTNAIKYKRDNEPLEIKVTIRKEEEFFVIEVSDNGIGMDLNRYGHLLFTPFKRLTVDRSGMGIGLSIINSAITKAGGKIEVQSKLGKGATFAAYLPDMEK